MAEASTPVVDQGWVTSSYSSGSGNCVQVRHQSGVVGVRDSKNIGPVPMFPSTAWQTFISSIG